jgi:hypothetical protein
MQSRQFTEKSGRAVIDVQERIMRRRAGAFYSARAVAPTCLPITVASG